MANSFYSFEKGLLHEAFALSSWRVWLYFATLFIQKPYKYLTQWCTLIHEGYGTRPPEWVPETADSTTSYLDYMSPLCTVHTLT